MEEQRYGFRPECDGSSSSTRPIVEARAWRGGVPSCAARRLRTARWWGPTGGQACRELPCLRFAAAPLPVTFGDLRSARSPSDDRPCRVSSAVSKPNHIIEELYRLCTHALARLDGALLLECAEGPHLVWLDVVLDPDLSSTPSARAARPPSPRCGPRCACGGRDAFRLDRPRRRAPRFGAHGRAPRPARFERLAPRLARRHGRLDRRWLRARRADLDRIAGALGQLSPRSPIDSDPRRLLSVALRTAARLHGERCVRVFSGALEVGRAEDSARRDRPVAASIASWRC